MPVDTVGPPARVGGVILGRGYGWFFLQRFGRAVRHAGQQGRPFAGAGGAGHGVHGCSGRRGQHFQVACISCERSFDEHRPLVSGQRQAVGGDQCQVEADTGAAQARSGRRLCADPAGRHALERAGVGDDGRQQHGAFVERGRDVCVIRLNAVALHQDVVFAPAHEPGRGHWVAKGVYVDQRAASHSNMHDAVKSKLFRIGVEACTVGSYEFYLGYAIRKGMLLCLDMGHFHPTENIADKLSAAALSLDEILLHVSRPMRWDSDHVILRNDDILTMAHELVSADLLGRTHIGLDFFDATISRTAAWVIGTRNMQKALLRALLTPLDRLRQAETALDFTARLTMTEEFKDLPFGDIWSEFCCRSDRPTGLGLIRELDSYQARVADRG